MIGKKFGKLTVLEYSHTDKRHNKCYKCICECGNTHTATGYRLRCGKTTSCGCKRYTSRVKFDNNLFGIPNIKKLCMYWMHALGYDSAYISQNLHMSTITIRKYKESLGINTIAEHGGKHVSIKRWLIRNACNMRDEDKPWRDANSLYCDKPVLEKILNKKLGDD